MEIRLTEREKKEALQLLTGVLAVPSVNGQNREADVSDYLKRYFGDTTYEAKIQMIDEKRGNFILDVPGKRAENHVIWNGHMDTVPYGELSAWKRDPAVPVIEDGKIYARGASDMKGGLCAMAFALHYLWKNGLVPEENIRFLATCDEERNGDGAAALLKEGYFGKPDFLLIGEPTACEIGIAQKGCIWLEIQVTGRTSHGAYPHRGINAAELGFDLCRRISDAVTACEDPVLQKATAALTQVQGGVANNMIPDKARFVMDLRLIPGKSADWLGQKLEQIRGSMEDEHPGLGIQFKILNNRIPVSLSAEHERTRMLAETIEKAAGRTPGNIGIYFFTDASVFLRDHDVPTLLFGPGTPELCHKVDECMELELYYRAIEVYLNLLCQPVHQVIP